MMVWAVAVAVQQAWNNVGGFDAVVQSFLVVGSGKMMTLAKKKPVRATVPHACVCV